MRLNGKVAIITGSSSGIGRATAILFAKEGAKVVVNYSHSEDEANEVVETIKKSGGEAIAIKADVSDEAAIIEMVDKTIKKYKKIDILYSNAGIEFTKPVTVTSVEEWDKVLTINLRGMFLCAKHVIPKMIENGGGSIVNTSSGAALIGQPNLSAYSASKGGVLSLTRVLAVEYAQNKIRVNCICPGAIDTPMLRRFINSSPDPKETERQLAMIHPLGRLGKPEEIAHAALYLASDESSFVTGHALIVDGGATAE